jgi:hypothetical protein
MVSEEKVLKKIFGPKREEETGNRRNWIVISFVICTLHQTFY